MVPKVFHTNLSGAGKLPKAKSQRAARGGQACTQLVELNRP